MTAYPFLFTFSDLIAGNGFVAKVAASGRVLLVEEDDKDWWLFGVQPGGLAGGAPDRTVALDEFKKSYLSVLLDFAAEAGSYSEFEDQVKRFFAEVNEPNAADWQKALEDVRNGLTTYPGIICIKDPSQSRPRIEVTQIREATATPGANGDLEPSYARAA